MQLNILIWTMMYEYVRSVSVWMHLWQIMCTKMHSCRFNLKKENPICDSCTNKIHTINEKNQRTANTTTKFERDDLICPKSFGVGVILWRWKKFRYMWHNEKWFFFFFFFWFLSQVVVWLMIYLFKWFFHNYCVSVCVDVTGWVNLKPIQDFRQNYF